MSFTNFSTGHSHSFGGTYVELVPNRCIRYNDRFDDPGLPGEMNVTVTLTEVSCGPALHVVQEGIPDVIPVDQRYLGWQESLVLLGKLVEPDLPHGAGAAACPPQPPAKEQCQEQPRGFRVCQLGTTAGRDRS